MKKIVVFLLTAVMTVMSFCAMGVTSFAANPLQTSIQELEKQIAEWEQSLKWYETHRDSTAGLEHCVGGMVVQRNPLIIHGSGMTNDFSGYIHVVNSYIPDEHFTLIGFTGFVRSLGYSVMTYNGYTVWEYELVESEQYYTEISNLDSKIRSARSELNSLKKVEKYYDRIEYHFCFNEWDWNRELDYIRLLPNKSMDMNRIKNIGVGGDYIETFTYSSNNPKVATIDEKGHVKAKKPGIAIITATGKITGLQAKCTVKVASPATKITLKQEKVNLSCGRKYRIQTTLTPKKSNDYLQYLSSDETVATVNNKGVVLAKNPGTAYIAIMSESGLYKIMTVRVLKKNAPAPTNEYLAVKAAKEYHEERIEPNEMNHYFTSDDGDKCVVKVSPFEKSISAYIDAIRTYQKTYTVTGIYGKYTYDFDKKKIVMKEVDGIKFTGDFAGATRVEIYDDAYRTDYYGNEYNYYLGLNDRIHFQLKADNSVAEKAFWSSSNEYVATVDQNGVVTVHHYGITDITCQMEGGQKATQTVLVGIHNLRLSANEEIEIGVSDRIKLGHITDEGTWSSSNTDVATVSSDGEIVGVRDGWCDITFVSKGGVENTVECSVYTICDDNTDDSLYQYFKKYTYSEDTFDYMMDLIIGDSIYYHLLSDKIVKKESSVIRVDSNGIIHAIGKGEETLTLHFDCGDEGIKTLYMVIKVYE